MNEKYSAIAASIALGFAANAYAQGSPETSGSSSQGSQSPTQQIEQQHQSAMKQCDNMKDNAKEICKAEADGRKTVAEAEAKVQQRGTPKNQLELAEAKAEAQYNVEKAKC